MSADFWLGLCLQAAVVPAAPVAVAVSVAPQKAVVTDVAVDGVNPPPGETVPAEESAGDEGEGPSSPPGPEVTITTLEGQRMNGSLLPSIEGRIGLGSSDFAEPLVIRPDRLASLAFIGKSVDTDRVPGLLEFVLVDGSRLHGDVLEITPSAWQLRATGIGTFRLPASSVIRAENLGGATGDEAGLV